jgi:nicotinamidase-related amidase
MDRFQESMEMYKQRGFSQRVGFGKSPAIIVVDFINAFTDDSYKLGGNYDQQIERLIPLLEKGREKKAPIIYTTTAYHPSFKDGGVFIKKVPALKELVLGTPAVEVDARIEPQKEDYLITKKYASSFFGTSLSSLLTSLEVDTLIITGCTTSGCIRATVIDANQNGYRPIIPMECTGDRTNLLHENNLFDMDAKYGDVTETSSVIDYLGTF